ncbi:hypothetical protein BKA83DRAFT_4054096, partial [Pisolithus microcarpus]
GPKFNLPAALCFYCALCVYPSPVELIVINERTIPLPVFQIVMQLTNMDVSSPSLPPGKGDTWLSDNNDELGATWPLSEASLPEWDKVTDPSSQTPAL